MPALLLLLPFGLIDAALAASVTLKPTDDVKTLTSSLAPGDVITFSAGTYEITERLDWSGLGTADQPIVLKAAEGAEVILVSSVNDQTIRIYESSYLTVQGLTLVGAEGWEDGTISPGGIRIESSTNITVTDMAFEELWRTAVYFYGDNSTITFTNNEIGDIVDGYGMYIGCGDASCWTQDSLIAENLIHDLRDDGGYGIYLEHGCQNNVVRDNVMYNLSYRGLLVASTEYGLPNVVEGNAMWGVTDLGLYVTGSAVVRNNLVFNTGSYGIYTKQNSRGTLADAVISHNTIANTTREGLYVEGWATLTGMVLANNVVSNPVGDAFYAGAGQIDEGNYIAGNVMTGKVDGLDPLLGHFIPGHGDADFVDATGWDFYPSSASVLVGAADASGEAYVPATDFNGAERDGASPDAGAYERRETTNPGWQIQEGFKVLGVQGGDGGEAVGGCCSDKQSKGEQAALALPLLAFALRRRRRA